MADFNFTAAGDGTTWEDPTNWDQNNGLYPGQDGAEDSADTGGYPVLLSTSIPNCAIFADNNTLTIAAGVTTGSITTYTSSGAAPGQVVAQGDLTINGDFYADLSTASANGFYVYTALDCSAGFLTIVGTLTINPDDNDGSSCTILCAGCNIFSFVTSQVYSTNFNLTSTAAVTITGLVAALSTDSGYNPSQEFAITGTDITIGSINANAIGGRLDIEATSTLTIGAISANLYEANDGYGIYVPAIQLSGTTITLGNVDWGAQGIFAIAAGTQLVWNGYLNTHAGGMQPQFTGPIIPNPEFLAMTLKSSVDFYSADRINAGGANAGITNASAANIKSGATLLGITGTLGSGINGSSLLGAAI